MKHISLAGLTILTAGTMPLTGYSKDAARAKRPNILICVADDAGHFSAYGHPWVSTPAFDSVAARGVLFNNAFTCNAKSAPSRACMITGRNSWQLEEAANHWCNFPAKFKSLAEALGEQGYTTGFTGKGWGPGVAKTDDGTDRRLTGKAYNKIKTTPPTPDISPIDYAANFERFIAERPADQPFCFWYGAKEPHRGYEYGSGLAAGKTLADIDSVPSYWPDNEKVRTDMLDYALEVEHFDRHLGRILHTLDSIGELDNTLVIVTSDHGMPFPRVKGQDYYFSNHIPLAVMWGDRLSDPGRTDNQLISIIDFAPTILQATGIDQASTGMEPIEGKSFMDILCPGEYEQPARDFVLMGKERHDVGRPDDQGYPIRAILRGNYLYIHNYEPDRWPAGDPSTGYMNVDGSPTKTEIIQARHNPATHRLWELSMGKRPEAELYDISTDPLCMNNLADSPELADTVRRMETELTALLTAQGDPRMEGNGAIFDNYPNMSTSRLFYNHFQNGEILPFKWINESDFDPEAEKEGYKVKGL